MKLTHFIPALAIMALTTTGCGSLRNSSKADKTPDSVPATKVEAVEVTPISDILKTFDGEWSIVEVNGENVVVNGENHPKLTFTINEATPGMVSVIGYNGCNYLNGAWNIKGSKIVPAGELISTMKAPPMSMPSTRHSTRPSHISLPTPPIWCCCHRHQHLS